VIIHRISSIKLETRVVNRINPLHDTIRVSSVGSEVTLQSSSSSAFISIHQIKVSVKVANQVLLYLLFQFNEYLRLVRVQEKPVCITKKLIEKLGAFD